LIGIYFSEFQVNVFFPVCCYCLTDFVYSFIIYFAKNQPKFMQKHKTLKAQRNSVKHHIITEFTDKVKVIHLAFLTDMSYELT